MANPDPSPATATEIRLLCGRCDRTQCDERPSMVTVVAGDTPALLLVVTDSWEWLTVRANVDQVDALVATLLEWRAQQGVGDAASS
jgi:hypothetical protein